MTDLLTLNPATLMPSAELNLLIHTKWMGRFAEEALIPNYSTNAAYAGLARRKARAWRLSIDDGIVKCCIECDGVVFLGVALIEEVNGEEARAEPLATSRAIAAALQAKEKKIDNVVNQ